jgi:hypothetical protein
MSEPLRYNLITGATAFTRILIRLGIVDRERREFWRFFVRAAGNRHKLIEAMRLAALGYHFRKLNEAYGD